ncbi:MAG: hypothetical protein FIA91_08435, partial [Geobacter sp.]|nr:hypothetical protein [Geobacter sp.]
MVQITLLKYFYLIPVILLLAAVSPTADAAADIYRLDNGDDAVTFTDTPNDRRYQMVQKELPARAVPTGKVQGRAAGKRADSLPAKADTSLSGRGLP